MKAFDSSFVALPRRWHQAASFARLLISVPPGQWALSWHGASATLGVGLVACGLLMWDQSQVRRHASAATELARAQAALSSAQSSATNPHTAPDIQLPGAAAPERLLRHLEEVASERSVTIQSLQIERSSQPASGVTPVRFVTTARGSYAGIKAWLADLLGRHPTLAISSLALRRLTADSPELAASVTLVLYVGPGR